MPKVSVIVPVYGVEKYIERCARSLFEQTLEDIEYLFIDDCSPDSSIDVLLHLLNDYPSRKNHVLIHRMDHNSGQAAVRRWGMQNASGDFVIHCDSDDWLEPDSYRLLYEKAIVDGSDIVLCDYSMTDGRTNTIVRGYTAANKEAFIHNLLSQKDPWSLCNKLFRRATCYGRGIIFPKGDMGEDMVITLQMLLNGEKMSYVPQSLYNYYYNAGSITHSPSEQTRIKNFHQFKDNVDLLANVFYSRGLVKTYRNGLDYLKWCVKRIIWSMPYDKGRIILWKETYKDINCRVFFNKYITAQEKVKLILTYLGLYPRNKEYYERTEG